MNPVILEIAIYDENRLDNNPLSSDHFLKFEFASIDEAISNVEFMKLGYDFFKDSKALAIRLEPGSQVFLIDANSVYPIKDLYESLVEKYKTTEVVLNSENTNDEEIQFKITEKENLNSNFIFEEDQNTKYAKTTKGQILPFKLYNADDTETRSNLLWESEDRGESTDFAIIERVFAENNLLDFTGPTKLNDYNDVAYLFKSLQDEAIEHAFLVYDFKEKGYFVQHLSSGTFNTTLIDFKTITHNVVKANPNSVWFIHNHPSGNLSTSDADIKTLSRLKRTLEHTDVKVEDGIIMNLRSGNFLSFSDLNIQYHIPSPSSTTISPLNDEFKVQAHSFSKQIYATNFQPLKLNSIDDVIKYVSTQKFGISDKTELLVLNNSLSVVAKLLMPPKDQINFIIDKISTFGGSIGILYGNNITPQLVNFYNDRLKHVGISLTDGILVKSENGEKIYQSFCQDELLDLNKIKKSESITYFADKKHSKNNYLLTPKNKDMNDLDILSLLPKNRQGENFHLKVSKEEAEYLIKNDIVQDIMNAEYGEDEAWVGMTKDDFNEGTDLFDEDYQTFEIDLRGQSKTNIEAILHEIEKYEQLPEFQIEILEQSALLTNVKANNIYEAKEIALERHNNEFTQKFQFSKQPGEIVAREKSRERGVSLNIPLQSHLSDAMFEMSEMSFNPELAKQRLKFVKELLNTYDDLNQNISRDTLDEIWNNLYPSDNEKKIENQEKNFSERYEEELEATASGFSLEDIIEVEKDDNILNQRAGRGERQHTIDNNIENNHDKWYQDRIDESEREFIEMAKNNNDPAYDYVLLEDLNISQEQKNAFQEYIEFGKENGIDLLTDEQLEKLPSRIESFDLSKMGKIYLAYEELDFPEKGISYSLQNNKILKTEIDQDLGTSRNYLHKTKVHFNDDSKPKVSENEYIDFMKDLNDYPDVIIHLSEYQKKELDNSKYIRIPDPVNTDEFYAALSINEDNTVNITWAHGEEETYPLEKVFGKDYEYQITNNININKNEQQMESTQKKEAQELAVGRYANIKDSEGKIEFKGNIDKIDGNEVTLKNKEGITASTNKENIYQYFYGQKHDLSEVKEILNSKRLPAGLELKDFTQKDLTQLMKGKQTDTLFKGVKTEDGKEPIEYEFKIIPRYNKDDGRVSPEPEWKRDDFEITTSKIFGQDLDEESRNSLKEGKELTLSVNKDGNDTFFKVGYDEKLNNVIYLGFANKPQEKEDLKQKKSNSIKM